MGPELSVVLNSSAFKVQELQEGVFVLVLTLLPLVPKNCFTFPHLSFGLAFVRVF